MEIVMFWRDKHWQSKGSAENVWLHIYPDTGEYDMYVGMYQDIRNPNIVEVVRKSDINDMVRYLVETCNYREKED